TRRVLRSRRSTQRARSCWLTRRRGDRGVGAGPGFALRESERSSPGSTFVMNVVSAGGIRAHPDREAARRGRPDTAWSRRVRLSTPALARGAAGPGAAVQRIAPSWRGRGKVPHSTAHGSAPWKLAAPGAAKSQPGAAQPGLMEVGRAGRGEVPTQRRAALRPWKFAAPGCAKFAPKGRVNRMEGR